MIFKSQHALEKYTKTKFRVRKSVRWLEHVPCLITEHQTNNKWNMGKKTVNKELIKKETSAVDHRG